MAALSERPVFATSGAAGDAAAGETTATDTDDKARGRALLAEGLTLLDNGRAREALAKFEAAYRIVPSPKVLFNMGLAHQALGDAIAALACFEGFLSELPDAPEDARVYAERQVRLLRGDLSFVEVSANLPGAEVWLDDHLRGVLPLSAAIVVVPGPHQVSLRQRGQEIFQQPVVTVRGQSTRVFAVAPTPAVAKAGAAHSWQRTAFWVAAGVATVTLAGGITAHVIYEGKSSDYRDLLGTGVCAVGAPDRPRCESLRSDAVTARALAWGGYSAAVVSAGAAVAFWLLQPSGERPTEHVGVACAPSLEMAGLSCVGRY